MCDPCAHRAVLRAVKALAKSPAARCIDPDAAMPWMPFTADGQRIRTKAANEPLRDIESLAVWRYIRELEQVIGPRIDELEKIARDWKGPLSGLAQRIQETALGMRADMMKEIVEISKPYVGIMADAGARAGLASLPDVPNISALVVEFGQANQLAVRAAERGASRMAQVVAQGFADRVAQAVARGIDEGRTIDQIASEIGDVGFSRDRAVMIARTESAYAYSEGRIEVWKETGVVEGKRWLLSPDACEFCEAAAREYGQKTIPLDTPFYMQGHVLTGTDGGTMRLSYRNVDGPPLHPNCRCDIIASIDPRVLQT